MIKTLTRWERMRRLRCLTIDGESEQWCLSIHWLDLGVEACNMDQRRSASILMIINPITKGTACASSIPNPLPRYTDLNQRIFLSCWLTPFFIPFFIPYLLPLSLQALFITIRTHVLVPIQLLLLSLIPVCPWHFTYLLDIIPLIGICILCGRITFSIQTVGLICLRCPPNDLYCMRPISPEIVLVDEPWPVSLPKPGLFINIWPIVILPEALSFACKPYFDALSPNFGCCLR
jgi:hypothetical protein